MKKEEKSNRTNFYNSSYSDFYNLNKKMKQKMNWTKGIDKLDTAIWVLVSKEEGVYFPARYLKKQQKLEKQLQDMEINTTSSLSNRNNIN